LKGYIHQIEEASFRSQLFRNPELTVDDIAAHLKIPSSHISFVFKYHCKETFPDYKKIVRVQDAIKLLEKGYLKTNTVESLSAEVGFATYNTFPVAFKNITGANTQEIVKRF
jgi:AraC-like DNA-binding protein